MSDAVEPGAPPAAPPKQDPEDFVLRGRPRRVVRFRRGVVIGSAAFGSALLVTIAWLALEPPTFRSVAGSDDSEVHGPRGAPEALAGAPSTYAEVPRLGPPLPGDLGKPILDHERSLGAGPGPAGGRDGHPAPAGGESPEKAARESALLVQIASRTAPAEPAREPERTPAEAIAPAGADPAAGNATGQGHKLAFVQETSGEGTGTNPNRLVGAPSRWLLSAGTIIPASLVTGLDSDLPGMVVAQVSENVFDSLTGRYVLVPQGARLIGKYDSLVAFGQRRALVVWQRILFPDGASIRLDNAPATDLSGYSGLSDQVDAHGLQLLKGVALASLLGVGTELSFGSGEGDLVRALRESAQQNAAHAGDQLTSRSLEVQPTIRVRPGWPVRALLSKDLVLRPWSQGR